MSPSGEEGTHPGRFVADPHTAILVAERDSEGQPAPGRPVPASLIGAVMIRIYDTPADPSMVPRRRAHVEALVVDEAHRRGGVGTALMEAATAWARARGTSEILLTVWAGNVAGEAFYERLGYRVVSRALAKVL